MKRKKELLLVCSNNVKYHVILLSIFIIVSFTMADSTSTDDSKWYRKETGAHYKNAVGITMKGYPILLVGYRRWFNERLGSELSFGFSKSKNEEFGSRDTSFACNLDGYITLFKGTYGAILSHSVVNYHWMSGRYLTEEYRREGLAVSTGVAFEMFIWKYMFHSTIGGCKYWYTRDGYSSNELTFLFGLGFYYRF